MNHHLHTLVQDFSWRYQQGQSALVVNVEKRQTRLDPSGLVFQETLDLPQRRIPLPQRFGRALILWRRFAQDQNLEGFELGYQHQQLRHDEHGPLAPVQLWTLHLNLTTPGLGLHLISHKSHREPDHRAWMARLRLIARAKKMVPVTEVDRPLVFSGDLLIECLGGALTHRSDFDDPRGEWQRPQSHDPAFLEDLGLGQEQVRFVAHDLAQQPGDAWQVIAFNRRQQSLVCYGGPKGSESFMSYQLKEPFHRAFDELVFCHGTGHGLLGDVQIEMPGAYWLPDGSRPSKA